MKFELRSIVAAAAMVLALGACQAEKKPASPGTAGGEVLSGSASDAMLPLDSLRSQPPLAPRPSGGASTPGPKARPGATEAAEQEPAEEAAAPAEPAEPAAAQ